MFLRSASTGDRPSDPHPLKAAGGGYPNSLAGLSANAGADEGKVTLIFCVASYCDGEPTRCYCCLNEKPKPLCYNTESVCRKHLVIPNARPS